MKRDVKSIEIAFVTHNKHKFVEASNLVSEWGINLVMIQLNKIELQASSLRDVAIHAAIEAYGHLKKPLIVEDAGLFIEALNGFPGVYSSYTYSTIGVKGLTTLLIKERNRSAFFEAVVVYFDGKELKTFSGHVYGFILNKPIGKKGFGFDPIFSPKELFPKSFGQMSVREKNKFSHRAQAFTAFAKWYTGSINYT
ncbi:MAG: RdgB/HAM1 family non-canonical purine NTP pyrophosphatase [Thermoprotei archaeon]